MSHSELLASLRPEHVQLVLRVEDLSGVLQLVIQKNDKKELSAVPCTPELIQCFGTFYSVITNQLTSLDLPLFLRDYPDFYWATWSDVADYVRSRFDAATPGDLNLIIAEILGYIPYAPLVEELRKALVKNPSYLIDLLNFTRQPISRGKILLSQLWMCSGVYLWAAAASKKKPLWSGPVGSDSMPTPSPFTEKELERNFREVLATFVPSPALQLPGFSAPLSIEDSVDFGRGPSPYDDDPTPFAEVLNKVLSATGDLPQESVAKAVIRLHTELSPICSVAKLTPLLLRATDPAQLTAMLSVFSWPQGPDSPKVTAALVRWLRFVDSANLISATLSVKQKILRETLKLLPEDVPCWLTLAIDLTVSLGDAFRPEELDPLLRATTRASVAQALGSLTVAATTHSALKAIQSNFQRVLGGQPPPTDWAAQMVSQYLSSGSSVPQEGFKPTSLTAPYSSSSLSSTSRIGVHMSVDGSSVVPWPSLQSALAAHFSDDVHVGQPMRPQVRYVYASVSSEAWSRTAAGRSGWQIPLGCGLSATITCKRGDGSPVDPPIKAAPLHTFTQHLHAPDASAASSSLGKRSRSPSLPSRSPQPSRRDSPSRPYPQRVPPPTSSPGRRAASFSALPSYRRGGGRALVTRAWPGRQGPGQL
jgi:hypothetical protein